MSRRTATLRIAAALLITGRGAAAQQVVPIDVGVERRSTARSGVTMYAFPGLGGMGVTARVAGAGHTSLTVYGPTGARLASASGNGGAATPVLQLPSDGIYLLGVVRADSTAFHLVRVDLAPQYAYCTAVTPREVWSLRQIRYISEPMPVSIPGELVTEQAETEILPPQFAMALGGAGIPPGWTNLACHVSRSERLRDSLSGVFQASVGEFSRVVGVPFTFERQQDRPPTQRPRAEVVVELPSDWPSGPASTPGTGRNGNRDSSSFTREYADGGYRIDVVAGSYGATPLLTEDFPGEMRVESTVRFTGRRDSRQSAGVSFSHTLGGAHAFLLDEESRYFLASYAEETWRPQRGSRRAAHPAIRRGPGVSNDLAVVVRGDSATLFVNGAEVTTQPLYHYMAGSRYVPGYFRSPARHTAAGLVVGLPGAAAVFSRFVIRPN